MAKQDDAFFIGWLPLPHSYARFLRPVAVGMLLLAAVSALLLSAAQRSPGTAVWEDERPHTFEGIVYASPYALLRVEGEQPGDAVRTILLVEEGKFGAVERVQPFDGQPVRVTGTLLHRDGRCLLELAEGTAGLQAMSRKKPQAAQLRRGGIQARGTVTLRGEIIDSKCYLGAMKPGGGKTHKACAALCLAGGVPPMLVTRDRDNRETYYLLTASDGGPLARDAFDYVGDPVEVTGRLELDGDLQVLKVAASDIRRR